MNEESYIPSDKENKLKGDNNRLIIVIGVMVALFGLVIYILYQINKSQQQKIDTLNKEVVTRDIIFNKKIKDTLNYYGYYITRFDSIRNVISKRDSVHLTIKYHIGDIVYIKPDSTKAVIDEIIWNHDLNYYLYTVLQLNSGIVTRKEYKHELIY